MRIFLIWPDTSQEAIDLVSGLKKSGHEIIYWASTRKNEGKFPGVILHDHYDAWEGIPPKELADVVFDPPSEDLIEKMSSVESIILTMMNKHFEGKSVDERKNLYYSLLGYWYGILNKFKPEAIVFSSVPHPTYSYLVFELARLLKIKTLMMQPISDIGRIVWYHNFWQGSPALQEALVANKDKKFILDDLSEDLKLYFEFYTNENNDPTPSYFKKALEKNNLRNKILLKARLAVKSVKDLTIFKKAFLYVKKLLVDNARKEYRRLIIQPDLSQKFIYVPLHYQPECNTSPQGGAFVNQILMIKILSASLPKGWRIYVKEHPAQWMAFGLNYTDYRYKGYYQRIAEIKNVQLVPIETNSFLLINRSQAIANVTGTVGWEAILRQKPALVFGCAWYNDYPGILKVNGAEACRAAINKIENGYRPDRQSVINYLKCVELASFRNPIDERIKGDLKFTKQERLDNILAMINRELKNLN